MALICLPLLSLLSCQSQRIPADTEELAPGVHHHAVHMLDGPWSIHVIEIDLRRAWPAGVRLRSARATSSAAGLAKTSNLAATALAAINGDFYFADSPIRTSGLQISHGLLVEEPRSRSAFAMSTDGTPMIAVFKFNAGLITAAGNLLPIALFNRSPFNGQLTYFNRSAAATRDSVRADIGFLLQSLGDQSVLNDTVSARVLQVRRQGWPLKLASGQWLVAGGPTHAARNQIAAGDTV